MPEETQALYPASDVQLRPGLSSRNNRPTRRQAQLNALPGKGRRNRAAREREEAEAFAALRRQHPAVESAINSLEHRGLDRVRSHGSEGFARMVALSVLAGNLHRLGRPATAGAGRQATTQTTRRLIGGGVAHTSAFEPAPEETGTAPYGRVPWPVHLHPTQTDGWAKLGCNWRRQKAPMAGRH